MQDAYRPCFPHIHSFYYRTGIYPYDRIVAGVTTCPYAHMPVSLRPYARLNARQTTTYALDALGVESSLYGVMD